MIYYENVAFRGSIKGFSNRPGWALSYFYQDKIKAVSIPQFGRTKNLDISQSFVRQKSRKNRALEYSWDKVIVLKVDKNGGVIRVPCASDLAYFDMLPAGVCFGGGSDASVKGPRRWALEKKYESTVMSDQ
jgi:hypothetical protein